MTWKHGFYTDTQESFSQADDAEEARHAADDIVDVYRENAEDREEWSDFVGYVHYGICLPLGVATQEPIDDELFEDAVDYHLREPEIDAAAFWAVVSKHAPKLAKAIARAVEETPDESWQPLTADTVLPESGYLVLHHRARYLELASYQRRVGWWATGDKDYGDAAELATDYTHYRVLRGPEGL